MAKKCLIVKQKRQSKFTTRSYNRCQLCGRARGFYRKFRICRICLRSLAHQGEIPGMKKSSW